MAGSTMSLSQKLMNTWDRWRGGDQFIVSKSELKFSCSTVFELGKRSSFLFRLNTKFLQKI